MRRLQIIRKSISLLLMVVLILLCISIFYQKYILHSPIINIGSFSFLYNMSGSMSPTLTPGEFLISSKQNKYNTGDIICYKKEDFPFQIIKHRIVNINSDNIVCKGDSNNIPDDYISKENIIGKVIYHSHLLGMLYMLLPFIFIIICIFILIYIFKKIKRGVKQ